MCCAFLLHREEKKRSFQAEAALVTEPSPYANLDVSDSLFFFSYVLAHTRRLAAAGGMLRVISLCTHAPKQAAGRHTHTQLHVIHALQQPHPSRLLAL